MTALCQRWNIKNEWRQDSDDLLLSWNETARFTSYVEWREQDKKFTWTLHIETVEARAFLTFITIYPLFYRLCGLVVRVAGCRPRGPGFDFQLYQILWVAVGLERGPLSLVSINEELLERKK
jgi:hypothetical protein